MATTVEYAMLSSRVYDADPSRNRTFAPPGWTELAWQPDLAFSGFSAGAYRNDATGENDRNREIVTKAEIARESILQHVEKSGGKEKAKTYSQVLDTRVEQAVADTIKKTATEDRSFCKRHLRAMSSGEWDIRNRDIGAYRKLMH